MSVSDLGKSAACFGEFKCSKCRNRWQSCRAWAEHGQECKKCAERSLAHHLEKLYTYICSSCKSTWQWKFVQGGCQCQRCHSTVLCQPLDQDNADDREYIVAHRLVALQEADGNSIDTSKEHLSDLCAKCQSLGRSCTGKGTFVLAKPRRSTSDLWAHPPISKDVFTTPKRTISSDSDSD